MNSSNQPTRPIQFPRLIYRKHIVIPTEHGSWPWLLVPFAVGAGVAERFNLAALLTLIGGLTVFFMRQPMTVWLRARRGKARAADGPIAAGWVLALAILGFLCLIGLIMLGRGAMLALTGPLAAVLVLYLVAARYGRAGLRSLWMELAGAAALAMMAPAAAIAANGRIIGWEWVLWGLMAAQNVLGALYVRLRVADTHRRAGRRWPVFVIHLVGLAVIVFWGLMGLTPLGTAVPFIFFLVRAGWTAAAPRPIPHIKRFGFTEMGVEIASGLWILISYWL
ncbi:MAG: hypothetical protein GY803_04590, partial [Chloroflexi bacterium]|nr:hypothetical protein [Chloroflexota bacterium]